MKLYILVEGECTELQLYPAWIKLLAPQLPQLHTIEEYENADRGFYIVSGFGYPSMLNHIENSILDIQQFGGDYFIAILDAEEDTVQKKKDEINESLSNCDIPENIYTHIIVQNRCVESMLLGNPTKIPRVNLTEQFDKYFAYYDVIQDDPELMGNYIEGDNHAQFHLKYLKQAFKIKKIRYSKSNCRDVIHPEFLNGIAERARAKNDMKSLQEFLDLMDSITQRMTPQTIGTKVPA